MRGWGAGVSEFIYYESKFKIKKKIFFWGGGAGGRGEGGGERGGGLGK